MSAQVAETLETLAGDAARLVSNLDHYWDDEGVNQLGIFIDPDLYQYVEKLYREAREFAVRCQGLTALAEQLRS